MPGPGVVESRDLRRQPPQQPRPRGAVGDRIGDRLEPAPQPTVQRVVVLRLPVRAMRRAVEAHVVGNEAGVAPAGLADWKRTRTTYSQSSATRMPYPPRTKTDQTR